MTIKNISRQELADFQRWLKTLPWNQTQHLYTTYFTEEARQEKTKELFDLYMSLTPAQRFPPVTKKK